MIAMMFRRARVPMTACAVALAAAGCSALDVSDPTAVEDNELDNAAGAGLLRGGAIRRMALVSSAAAVGTAIMTDEMHPNVYPSPGFIGQEEWVDRRALSGYDDYYAGGNYSLYTEYHELRKAASLAIPKLAAYGNAAHVGEMYALRGYAALGLGEAFCPGFPIHEVVGGVPVVGGPMTTQQVYERALADFDSALTFAADSGRVLNLTRVLQGRTLLQHGRFTEAAAAVSAVPSDFVYEALHSEADYQVYNAVAVVPEFGVVNRSVSNNEGGNGLDYVTAGDPRVVTHGVGTGYDGVTPLYGISKYMDRNAPLVLADGIEARLIEAEAALSGGPGNSLAILNQLRAERITPAMPPLADPGTPAAQLDLVMRERAFWLFATGHRLPDLRRLVELYGRAQETVFPSGPYTEGGAGGVYETATNLSFPWMYEQRFNPAITGCMSR